MYYAPTTPDEPEALTDGILNGTHACVSPGALCSTLPESSAQPQSYFLGDDLLLPGVTMPPAQMPATEPPAVATPSSIDTTSQRQSLAEGRPQDPENYIPTIAPDPPAVSLPTHLKNEKGISEIEDSLGHLERLRKLLFPKQCLSRFMLQNLVFILGRMTGETFKDMITTRSTFMHGVTVSAAGMRLRRLSETNANVYEAMKIVKKTKEDNSRKRKRDD